MVCQKNFKGKALACSVLKGDASLCFRWHISWSKPSVIYAPNVRADIDVMHQTSKKKYMDLKEIQKHIDKVMKEKNNRSIPEFEGYSLFEIRHVLHFKFELTVR